MQLCLINSFIYFIGDSSRYILYINLQQDFPWESDKYI